MSRYIDADRFEKWLSVKFSEGLIDLKTAENAASVLKYAPTADVKPIVRGEWVDNGISDSVLAKCSVCGIVWGSVTFDFCPGCGADMRGEQK